jgi:phosphoribosylanthranilate isomerase
MIVKVCGMRESANIEEIAFLKPDLMGFIFYPKSKRYVGEDFDTMLVQTVMPEIETTGVFVNEEIGSLIRLAEKYRFDYIQLHGNESPSYCQKVKDNGFKVLKAFGVNQEFEWEVLIKYIDVCDYFLFDTNTNNYGGSGQKFDWNLLLAYTYDKPFILSGGIKPEDAELINSLNHKQFAGVDINSGFEIHPGLKDPEKIKYFINHLRTS